MKKLFTSVFAVSCLISFSQNKTTEICAAKTVLDIQKAMDPSLEARMQEIEKFTEQWIKDHASSFKNGAPDHILATPITIPVVFHVVHKNANESISMARIIEQINVLNKDFSKQNADFNNVPAPFKAIAADCEIQFCLAQRDPQGAATMGVTYTTTSSASFSADDKVKFTAQGGHDVWDSKSYLNIWVCDLDNSTGVLGIGYFPGADPARDGVVVDYTTIGTSGSTAPYNLGRTVVHEVGHYFNLHHIWGDSQCGDDYVADTPIQYAQNAGCPTYPYVTCNNSPNGDMFMNYMDYSDHSCLLMFSQGQKARMLAALFGPRAALQSSLGCVPPSTTVPAAKFVSNSNVVVAGTTVSFSDLSSNNPTSWTWSFQGGSPATSTTQNVSVAYNTLGCYEVTLTASNSNGSNTKTQVCYINVVKDCDTLSNMTAQDSLSYYGAGTGAWGFMTGHSTYNAIGLAEKYSGAPNGYKVDGVHIIAGRAKHTQNSAVITVKVYDDDGTYQNNKGKTVTNAPKTVLGSTTTTYSFLDGHRFDGTVGYIKFSNPVTVSGAFFVGIEYQYAAGDTLAILSNKINKPWNTGTAWEKWNDGHWQEFKDADWWNTKVSLAIFPQVCDPLSGVSEVLVNSSFNLYPNPNNGEFTLSFMLKKNTDVYVRVLNMLGETVMLENYKNTIGGDFNMNLTAQKPGIYFVEVKAGEETVVKKIIIQ